MKEIHTKEELSELYKMKLAKEELTKIKNKYQGLPFDVSHEIKGLEDILNYELAKYNSLIGHKGTYTSSIGNSKPREGTITEISHIACYDVVVKFEYTTGGFDRLFISKIKLAD